jgi:ubiquinone/menaquinone biosynthesis C-methylase UbiE
LISARVVQRVNELFHDFAAEQYDELHPEIVVQEKDRWDRVAAVFLGRKRTHSIRVVDVGCGAGFVPLSIAGLLREGDLFACSDVSSGILEVAKRKIEERRFDCGFEYVKIDSDLPFKLPFDSGLADVVTVNSVLHHVKDVSVFLQEVDRIVKVGGLLFIGHEPNRYFYEHRFLWWNYLLLASFSRVTGKFVSSLVHRGQNEWGEVDREFEDSVTRRINETLKEEGLTKSRLSTEDIMKIVDYQYFVAERGFVPESLLSNYEVSYIETSDHLSFISYYWRAVPFIRLYDGLLEKSFPKCGAVFFVVLKKIREIGSS